MTKRAFLIAVSFLVAVVLIYFTFTRIDSKDLWQDFLSLSGWKIFLIFFLTAIFYFIPAWRLKVISKDKGYAIPLKKVFSLWTAGFFMDYFLPAFIGGGAALRGYILKEKFSMPLGKAGICAFVDDFLDAIVFFLIIIFGLIFFILETFTNSLKLWIVLLIFILLVSLSYLLITMAFKNQSVLKLAEKPLRKILKKKIPPEAFDLEKEIFIFFKTRNINMLSAIILSLLRGIVNWLRSWLLLLFLGMKINGFFALSVVAFTNLAYLFLLPAGLGSHEAFQTFSFSQLGLEAHSAIAFTLILRAFDSLFGILGVFFLFRFGASWLKKRLTH